MSLTRAERIARRAAWQIPREVKDVALHVHAVAVQTGDRAYQYERQSDGSLLEIRVWPSGDVKLTPVDDQGNSLVPTPKPTLNFQAGRGMAFPTVVGTIADFSQTDGTTLESLANWVKYSASNSSIVTATGQGKLSASTYAEYGYHVSRGPDVEGGFTIATKPTGNQTTGIWMAVRQGAAPGTSSADRNGYQIEIDTSTSGADLVLIYKKSSGAGTELARTTAVTFAAGDKLGFSVSGGATTTINVYRFTAGAWNQTPILTATDSTSPWTAAGSASFGMTDVAAGPGRIDDVFYGTTVAGSTLVASTRLLKWDISNNVSSTRALKWDLAALVSSVRSLVWDVGGNVASTRLLKWDILNNVSATRTLKWDVANNVSSTRALKWDLAALVSSVRALQWDVNSVIAAVASAWRSLMGVGR